VLNQSWYDKTLSLGYLDGYEVVTFTNSEKLPPNDPSEEYLETLAAGLRENYTEMTEEEIREYLKQLSRRNDIENPNKLKIESSQN